MKYAGSLPIEIETVDPCHCQGCRLLSGGRCLVFNKVLNIRTERLPECKSALAAKTFDPMQLIEETLRNGGSMRDAIIMIISREYPSIHYTADTLSPLVDRHRDTVRRWAKYGVVGIDGKPLYLQYRCINSRKFIHREDLAFFLWKWLYEGMSKEEILKSLKLPKKS